MRREPPRRIASGRQPLHRGERCQFTLSVARVRPQLGRQEVNDVTDSGDSCSRGRKRHQESDSLKDVVHPRIPCNAYPVIESLDRTRIVLAQTPQAFSYELLARAHREAADAGLDGDDDAQLVAATGHLVTVVEGEPANIKLTTPEDLEVVEALIREQEAAAQ